MKVASLSLFCMVKIGRRALVNPKRRCAYADLIPLDQPMLIRYRAYVNRATRSCSAARR